MLSIAIWPEGWMGLQGFLLLYLDPGGGSILLQAIIGALLAIWVFLRTQKERIRRFFSRSQNLDHEYDEG